MTLAALVISGVAATAAVLAMLAARRSARAVARAVQIDEERRHDERAPVFRSWFEQTSWDDGEPEAIDVVWFDYLAGPGALASVSVRLIMRTDAHDPVFVNIAAPDGDWSDRVELADPFDVEIGTETFVRVDRPQHRPSGEAVFALCCRAGFEEWEVPVRCEIPQDTWVVPE